MAIYRQKHRLQSFRRTFAVIIRRTLYHGNSVCSYRIWLVMTASVFVKNLNLDPRNKLHAIPGFTVGIICGPHRGSFAVQFGDHLRSGDHLQSGDHLRRCTGLLQDNRNLQLQMAYISVT